MKKYNPISILLVLLILLSSCSKESKNVSTESKPVEQQKANLGPTLNEIESEVMYLVPKISWEPLNYNSGTFLKKNDFIYKDLLVTSVRVNSRNNTQKSKRGDGVEEEMNLHITGTAEKYRFYTRNYAGATSYSIDKDFVFIKQDGKWKGYLIDKILDLKTGVREKDLIRFK